MKRVKYNQMEIGKLEVPDDILTYGFQGKFDDLESHEQCTIYRRYFGLSQSEAAKQYGCSRWWFNQMERGLQKHDRLLKFWEEQ